MMIPTHYEYQVPPGLKDLREDESFFKLCKSDKQDKFAECTECPFYDFPRTREQAIVTEEGVNVLIVAGNPSKEDIPYPETEEDRVGYEFRSKTWYGLKNYIRNNSLRPKGITIKYGLTTAVMCYSDKHTTKDYPINVIKQCGSILSRKVLHSGATAVVLMGRQACKASPVNALKKITSIDYVRGKIFKHNMGSRPVYFIPTHSARDVNRFPDLWSTVLHDLEKATYLHLSGFVKPEINDLVVNYVYPKTLKEVKQLLGPLTGSKKIVAFDIETTGLNPRNTDASVTVFSLAWGKGKAAAIYTHQVSQKIINEIIKFLESDTKKIAHNAQFDIGYMEELWGCNIKSLYADTMLTHYLLDENRAGGEERTLKGEFTLKKLVWDFLPAYGGYEEEGNIGDYFKKGKWHLIPKDVLLKYAAIDSDVTLQIFWKQLRILYNLPLEASTQELLDAQKNPINHKEKKLHKLAIKFMPRATRAVVNMKNTGMYIDTDYLNQLCTDIPNKIDQVEKFVKTQTGNQDISLSNNRNISWVLYKHLGLEVLAKTPTGNPKTDRATLTTLSRKSKNPIVDAIITFKKLHKLNSSFLKNIKNLRSPKTGRVHPSYLLIGTVTGRLSCRDPNLQQIPKYIELPDKSIINVKKIFCAAPDKILLHSDYSQVEMMVMAAMSSEYGDDSLKEAILGGLDLHCHVASQVFNVPYSEMFEYTKVDGKEKKEYLELRSRAKTVGFAILYGSSAYGIAYKQGIKIKEAQQLIDAFFDAFPGIRKFVKAKHLEAATWGFVTSPFGRRRRFPISRVRTKLDNSSKRKAQNSPIQSTASDICLHSVCGLTEEMPKIKGKVVVTVHDSLIVEVDNDPAVINKAAHIMQDVMVTKPMAEYEWLRGVPLKADLEIGYNWGEMKAYNP